MSRDQKNGLRQRGGKSFLLGEPLFEGLKEVSVTAAELVEEAWYETSWRSFHGPGHTGLVGHSGNFGLPRAM